MLDKAVSAKPAGNRPHQRPADLTCIAKVAGIPLTANITKPAEIEALRELALQTPGPVVAMVTVLYEDQKFVLPSNSGSYLIDRFRTAILGEGAASRLNFLV